MRKAQNQLADLKFGTVERPVRSVQRSPKNLVIEFIDHQIGIAEAEISGSRFFVRRMRYKKRADGTTYRTVINAHPRRYFWEADGQWLLECRYGNIPIEFSPGKPTIFAGPTLDDVLAVLRTLRAAVVAGEAVPGHGIKTARCAGYAANLNSVAASVSRPFCSALI
jgi:hypothetical protein